MQYAVDAAESDSERVCANSARMASAMALPSMTLPREGVVSEEDDIISFVNTAVVVVMMHVVGDSVVDAVDAGMGGRML